MYVMFIPVPSILYAVFYVGYSIWSQGKGDDNVNHSAHLWGAAFGVAFTLVTDPKVGLLFLSRLLSPLG
jgi:membrane associated rhomboid family serine protease